jgi:hypothetical protein
VITFISYDVDLALRGFFANLFASERQLGDNFMRQGFAPIKIVRKAMLHDDSPVL